MATAVKSSDLSLERNASIMLGVASLNLANQKTHAVSKITFNKSCTEAQVCFTKDQIQYGWPSDFISSSSPDPINEARISPGFTSNWTEITISTRAEDPLTRKYEDHPQLAKDFINKCIASVQQVTLIFDSENTYENTLLKDTVRCACRDVFPNLKSYSLVFSSL